jgi:hypothetical protein
MGFLDPFKAVLKAVQVFRTGPASANALSLTRCEEFA